MCPYYKNMENAEKYIFLIVYRNFENSNSVNWTEVH